MAKNRVQSRTRLRTSKRAEQIIGDGTELLCEGRRGDERSNPPLLTLGIPSETLEMLQALAVANGMPVSPLACGFIADGLATFGRLLERGWLEHSWGTLRKFKATPRRYDKQLIAAQCR